MTHKIETYDQHMNPEQVSQITGYSLNTLRKSRVTGTLAGVVAPSYFKMGARVRYPLKDLIEWMSQFEKVTSTSQIKSGTK